MAELSKTDQRRITFLSLLSSAATLGTDSNPYATAIDWLAAMEDDGFFASNPTSQRSERSARPESSSRSSNNGPRGRDRDSKPFSGQLRDPDGPPTDNQVNAVLKMSDDYTRRELEDMTKQEVSDLINDLKR
jgi:hypothetical protein